MSIHLPLTEETRQIVGAREISLMKPNAYLVNVSRGGVVKQDDLVEALKQGKILGAGLDVQDPEPPKPGDPIFDLPNVILSPHFAGDTYEAKQRVSTCVAREVLTVLQGNLPRFLVNPAVFKSPKLLTKWAKS